MTLFKAKSTKQNYVLAINHKNQALQQDWNTSRENNFALEILAELKENEEQAIHYQWELKSLQKQTVEQLNIPDELRN